MTLADRIESLKALRLYIARSAQTLAERELDARKLRLATEDGLRRAMPKTEAEREAKRAPDYVEHERESARLRYLHEVALAEAEATRLTIQMELIGISSVEDLQL